MRVTTRRALAGAAVSLAALLSTALLLPVARAAAVVGPASGGTSGGVTGGGTWETFSDNTSTGSGTYEVRELISWQFANFATPGSVIDEGGGTRANGNAVLRITYSDGSEGVLGVGCHGPGAPEGILEGVIATKGFVTYWNAQAPVGGVDANWTLFHVM
jgi:hypothetical protein